MYNTDAPQIEKTTHAHTTNSHVADEQRCSRCRPTFCPEHFPVRWCRFRNSVSQTLQNHDFQYGRYRMCPVCTNPLIDTFDVSGNKFEGDPWSMIASWPDLGELTHNACHPTKPIVLTHQFFRISYMHRHRIFQCQRQFYKRHDPSRNWHTHSTQGP